MDGEYKGDIVDGKRNGHGILTTTDGVYTGTFENDYVSGYGEFVGNDGGSYKGYWLNQEWQGVGNAVWPSGDKCLCEFEHDKMNGFAYYTRSNGGTYQGYYKNGVKSGVGKIIFVSDKRKGDIYIGEIENDFMQGHGKYYYANGTSEEGMFKENKFVSSQPFASSDSLKIVDKIESDYKRVLNKLNK